MTAPPLRGFMADLNKFADWCRVNKPAISEAVVAVTERYCRYRLNLKKDDELIYRGLKLKCIGSQLWRNRHVVD